MGSFFPGSVICGTTSCHFVLGSCHIEHQQIYFATTSSVHAHKHHYQTIALLLLTKEALTVNTNKSTAVDKILLLTTIDANISSCH
jgi:hypothetical protein